MEASNGHTRNHRRRHAGGHPHAGGGRRGPRRSGRDDVHDRRASRWTPRWTAGFSAASSASSSRARASSSPTSATTHGAGRVAFAGPYPGKIIQMDLSSSQMLCQKDSFLCAVGAIDLSIAFTKRLGAGFFGGEGFILQKMEGTGKLFIHSGGTIVPMTLAARRAPEGRYRLPRRARPDRRLRHRPGRRDQDVAVRRRRPVLRLADRARARLAADTAVLPARRSDPCSVQGRPGGRQARLRRPGGRPRRPDRGRPLTVSPAAGVRRGSAKIMFCRGAKGAPVQKEIADELSPYQGRAAEQARRDPRRRQRREAYSAGRDGEQLPAGRSRRPGRR